MHPLLTARGGAPYSLYMTKPALLEVRLERLTLRKLQPDGDGCWVFQGNIDRNGYGRIFVMGKGKQRAHRTAWFLSCGEWPNTLVLHSCDNRRCVRPSHLHLGSHLRNRREELERKGEHPGVRKGAAHVLAKLDEIGVLEIRQRLREGESYGRLAARFGVTPSNIQAIKNRRSWAWLSDA